MRRIAALSLAALLACAQAQEPLAPLPAAPDGTSASEFLALCAAAATERATIAAQIERRNTDSYNLLIGRYTRISCAYSSAPYTKEIYYRERDKAAFQTRLLMGACTGDPEACTGDLKKSIDLQLRSCAVFYDQNVGEIRKIPDSVNRSCRAGLQP
jgi:hypothetical protein